LKVDEPVDRPERVVGGMDATSGLPSDQRKMMITTKRIEELADVSVSESGTSVPSDKLNDIFIRSSPQRRREWESDCRLRAPSLKRIAAAYGQKIKR
jgi:hypothetical protein